MPSFKLIKPEPWRHITKEKREDENVGAEGLLLLLLNINMSDSLAL